MTHSKVELKNIKKKREEEGIEGKSIFFFFYQSSLFPLCYGKKMS